MTSLALTGLRLPQPPEKNAPFRFPVIASLAPVVVSVALWLITGSLFALVFAFLGPVTAVAALADARWGSRRRRRRDAERIETQTQRCRQQIDAEHGRLRALLNALAPSSARLVFGGADLGRWAAPPGDPVWVTVGIGTVRVHAGLEPSADLDADTPHDLLTRELIETASVVHTAPRVVDARRGIAWCGPSAVADAAARAVGVQLARTLSPADFWCSGDADWVRALPHPFRADASCAISFGRRGQTAPDIRLCVVTGVHAAPPGIGTIAAIAGGHTTLVRAVAGLGACGDALDEQYPEIVPDVLSAAHALDWALAARKDASALGLVNAALLPAMVDLAPLLRHPQSGVASLACEVGVATTGRLTLDLVQQGPHAVIGGTTGSGKSELLITWVLAMAAAWSPSVVTFLLVDFKGGSAFSPLAHLPHTVGIITDLDEAAASRALASLSAEVLHRERVLAQAGARSIDDIDGMARLVIVIDEFAALTEGRPQLHAVMADVAARGRSLGMHLIMCTQRPSGIVRDAVLANVDLRISMRVNNAADSTATIGSDEAAALPPELRGRGVVAIAGARQRVQFARAEVGTAGDVAARYAHVPAPRRPWLEPLAERIERDSTPHDLLAAPPGAIAWGVLDTPRLQSQPIAFYSPARQGGLLIAGAAGSGKSGALEAIAAGAERLAMPVAWLPASPDAAWDVLEAAVRGLRAGGELRLLIVDDADVVLAKFSGEHRAPVIDMLTTLAREGPAAGLVPVASTQRLTPEVNALASLLPARLFLRHASRHDLVLAGGDAALFDAAAPSGRGTWQGDTVQVFCGDGTRAPGVVPTVAPEVTGPLAVVSCRPETLARRLRAAGHTVCRVDDDVPAGATVIGDPTLWQSRWGVLDTLAKDRAVLYDRCSAAELRALTRSTRVPPPVVRDDDVLRQNAEGDWERVRLPRPLPGAIADQASTLASST